MCVCVGVISCGEATRYHTLSACMCVCVDTCLDHTTCHESVVEEESGVEFLSKECLGPLMGAKRLFPFPKTFTSVGAKVNGSSHSFDYNSRLSDSTSGDQLQAGDHLLSPYTDVVVKIDERDFEISQHRIRTLHATWSISDG